MPKRKFAIGSIVQEAGCLPADQIFQMKHLDLILAPSTFCRNAYLTSGLHPNKVFYIPYPLDTVKWNPTILPNEKKDDGIFRFLYMNTPFERKGIDLLIIAWLQEFKRGEPVELVIKTYQEHKEVIPKYLITKVAHEHKLSFSMAAPIRIVDKAMNDELLHGSRCSGRLHKLWWHNGLC
jgi:glycosyltransferase involved in cell wall biosynthesis